MQPIIVDLGRAESKRLPVISPLQQPPTLADVNLCVYRRTLGIVLNVNVNVNVRRR